MDIYNVVMKVYGKKLLNTLYVGEENWEAGNSSRSDDYKRTDCE